MKIVLLDGYELNQDLDWSGLKTTGNCDLFNRTPDDPATILRRIGQAEIVLTHKTKLAANVIEAAPSLKYIGIMGTGYDVADIDCARKHGIVVTNIPTYASNAVAQFVFSLLLEVTGQVGQHNQLVHAGQWARTTDFTFWAQPLIELAGKTMGLIGFGQIARRVAEIARAFGMRVIFYNHRTVVDKPDWAHQVSLDELLGNADVVSLHVIQVPETINLINQDAIAQMKPTVIIVNTARGKLVNESDVAQALNDGRMAAYATDVVSSEPIAADNPLLQAANCYITPHIAWAPEETRQRLLDMTVANLKAYQSGHPVNRVV